MIDPEPILVLGVNRSGTKWLCNELTRHPDVVSVAHPDHGGIVESNLLGSYGRSFDFEDEAGYRSFLDFWTGTHFFALAGGSRETFESTPDRPKGPVEAFKRLMDDYARREGASFWVQKVHPWSAAYVLERLPGARLVLIRRDITDTVRSRLKLDRERGMNTAAFRAALSIAIQGRELARVCRRKEVFTVSYGMLLERRNETMGAVADFVGLRAAVWDDYRFPRNTSFSNDRDRATVLSRLDVVSVRLAQLCAHGIPFSILRSLRRRLTNASGGPLPGTFRHLEQGPDSDYSRS